MALATSDEKLAASGPTVSALQGLAQSVFELCGYEPADAVPYLQRKLLEAPDLWMRPLVEYAAKRLIAGCSQPRTEPEPEPAPISQPATKAATPGPDRGAAALLQQGEEAYARFLEWKLNDGTPMRLATGRQCIEEGEKDIREGRYRLHVGTWKKKVGLLAKGNKIGEVMSGEDLRDLWLEAREDAE